MKKFLAGLMCITMIIVALSACGKSEVSDDVLSSTAQTTLEEEEYDLNKDPVDILTDAGLSQEMKDLYFNLTNERFVPLPILDFIDLAKANLTGKQIEEYSFTYKEKYTVKEYIQVIDEMKKAGLTEREIADYSYFMDSQSTNTYVENIKKLKSAGLTEEQIDMYSWYVDVDTQDFIDLFLNFEDPEEVLNNYSYFSENYAFKEYCSLISHLRTKTEEPSILPVYPLNENMLFVKRNISTYNLVEESIAILSADGEIITDWNPEWGDYDIQYRAKCGDYFFIITDSLANTYDCDVVNSSGQIITNISCKEKRYDIGEGYVFFSYGGDYGRIMNPQGEVIELQKASVGPSYCEKSMGALEEGDYIGQISEGLFYGLSIGNNNTAAYYYNTEGEVVIDLSTQAVNFKVTKMYDFSGGQARIEFTGADYKNYYVFIDKTGAFLEDPIEIAD